MNLPWLRLYTEFATDPVVQMLAFEDQRHFVMALCMKGSGVTDKEYPNEDFRSRVIAATLGLDALACSEASRRLQEAGLIDSRWQPLKWEKRQFSSDHDAAERKRRQRERDRHNEVTDESRDSHVLDKNRTDTEQKQRKKRAHCAPDDFHPDLEFARATLSGVDADAEAKRFKDYEFKTPKSNWNAAWRNWVRTCKDTGKYAKDGGKWM